MNKFIKTITPDRLSYEFLRSLNGLLDLTDRELELLSTFLDVHQRNLKSRKYRSAIDATENRKEIMFITGITKDNLSRYIKMFKDKKIFVKDSGLTSFNRALIPVIIANKVVQITMILKLNENEQL